MKVRIKETGEIRDVVEFYLKDELPEYRPSEVEFLPEENQKEPYESGSLRNTIVNFFKKHGVENESLQNDMFWLIAEWGNESREPVKETPDLQPIGTQWDPGLEREIVIKTVNELITRVNEISKLIK